MQNVEKFLGKVLNAVTGDKSTASRDKDWVDDAKCKTCYECEAPFSVFVKRHHCRICGRVFCGTCTKHSIPPPRDSADQTWLRVCNYCHRIRQRCDQPPHQISRTLHHVASVARSPPPLGQPNGSTEISLQPSESLNSEDGSSRPPLASRQRLGSSPLGRQSSRSLSSSVKSVAGDLTWEVPAVLEEDFGLSLADRDRLLLQQQMQEQQGQAPDPQQPLLDEQQPRNIFDVYRASLHEASQQHLQQLLQQLLQSEGVQQADVWLPVVMRLASAAAVGISPVAASTSGPIDPRAYIKVKKLPDVGRPEDSSVVQGVVCKKNVAHRRMRSCIENPTVLLLGGALEYHRLTNQLSSFETLMEQENEHLRAAIARIAALRPDLLLVERSVARFAQEELLRHNISLVLNIKHEQLERIARCMGTKVVPSLEQLAQNVVGFCKEFKVETVYGVHVQSATSTPTDAPALPVRQAVPLMYFEGCPKPVGVTVLLRGAANDQLVRVKRVTRFAAYCAYYMRLENAFLADQLAAATPIAAAADESLSSSLSMDTLRSLVTAAIKTSLVLALTALPTGMLLSVSPHSSIVDESVAGPLMYELGSVHAATDSFMLASPPPEVQVANANAAGANNGHATAAEAVFSAAASCRNSAGGATMVHEQQQQQQQQQLLQPRQGGPILLRSELAPLSKADSFVFSHASDAEPGSAATPSPFHSAFVPTSMEFGSDDHNSTASPNNQHLSRTLDSMEMAMRLSRSGSSIGPCIASFGGAALQIPPAISSPSAAQGALSPRDQHLHQQQHSLHQELSPSISEAFTDPLRRDEDADLAVSAVSTLFEPASALYSMEEMGQDARTDGTTSPGVGPFADAAVQSAAEDALAAHAGMSSHAMLRALQGLQVYDFQRIYISMSCRNPRKQLLCEPHAIKRIDFYSQSDLSLVQFIIAAAPHPHKKCGLVNCGEGVTAHVRTFLHSASRITLSIATVPASEALPGEDRQQVWMWVRPKGMGNEARAAVRRVPLSPEAMCLSFGQFLQLSFTADQLELGGRSLNQDYVRYFGIGRTIMCIYQDRIHPYRMEMPDLVMPYSLHAQLKWLKQESAELCQEADEAFEVVELALRDHPYFQAAAGESPGRDSMDAPASSGSLPAPSNNSTSQLTQVLTSAQHPSMPNMISAVRKDRTSFMDKVAESVRKATPNAASAGGTDMVYEVDNLGQWWDEQVMSGIMELNRLRRSLAITLLSWAATLQDPAAFAAAYARASSAGGGAGLGGAAGSAFASGAGASGFSCSETSGAIGAAGGVALDRGSLALASSESVPSLFGISPAAAVQRMGLSALEEGPATDAALTHTVPVPIMPNQAGPIAVPVVAELVARANCSSDPSNVPSAGSSYRELLEGSQGVMMAVSGQPLRHLGSGAASSLEKPLAPQVSGGQGHGMSPALSLDEALVLMPSGTNTTGAVTPALQMSDQEGEEEGEEDEQDGPAGESEEDDEQDHNQFLNWLSDHNVGDPMLDDEDTDSFYPHELPLDDELSSASNLLSAATLPVPTDHSATSTSSAPAVLSSTANGTLRPLGCRTVSKAHMQIHPHSATEHSEDGSLSPRVGKTVGVSPSMPLQHQQLQHQQQQQHQQAGPGRPRYASAPDASTLASPSLTRFASAGDPPPYPSTTHPAPSTNQPTANLSPRLLAQAIENATSRNPSDAATAAAAAATTSGRSSLGDRGSAGVRPLHESLGGTGHDSGDVAAAARSFGAKRGSLAEALSGSASQRHMSVSLPLTGSLVASSTETPAHTLSRENSLATSPTFRDISKTASFPKRTMQSVRRKLEALGSSMSGLNAIARVCLPGRALLPAGINDMVVPIYDSEPTSVIAHFLSTRAYQQMLNAAMKAVFQEARKAPSMGGGSSWDLGPQLQHLIPPTHSVTSQSLSSAHNSLNSSLNGALPLPSTAQGQGETLSEADWLTLLLSKEPAHVRHNFEDEAPGMPWAKAKFQVIAYYAPQFAEMRRRCVQGGEAAFITSLCRCRKWHTRGGKSNAYFAKTRDDRYIIKSLSKVEKASFLEFAPAYFEHVAKSTLSGRRTCLAKVVGVFSVGLKPQSGGSQLLGLSKEGVIDLVVMENCFYNRQISRIYDLKGSERNRFNADAAANPQDAKEVHLDDNLRRSNLTAPLFVEPATLRDMEAALWSDTAFLASLDIMDYSLLVGVDKENCCLSVAIIDFIRQFTWDKQLETWVKSSGMLGGNGKEPTIVSPKQYMKRFRLAMLSYFTVVPTSADMEAPLDPEA